VKARRFGERGVYDEVCAFLGGVVEDRNDERSGD
jgi:hypothetical protein